MQPITLEDLSRRFKKTDRFFFARWEDGFFTFRTDDTSDAMPFPQEITFRPSPFARLFQPATIDDLTAAVDTAYHFGLTIIF